MPQIQVCCFAP